MLLNHLALQYVSRRFLIIILLIASISPQTSLAAPQIISEQPLSFGRIAVAKSPSINHLTVTAEGQVQHTKGIYILQPGHPAKFSIIGYPSNTMLMINATIVKPKMDIDNTLKLIALTTPRTVTTDGTGFATIIVGGTLQSEGQPTKQAIETNYQAQIAIDIHY